MSTYSNLKIEEITLGDSGWGTTTTNNLLAIQQALQSVTLATGNFTSNVATLTLTNTNALQNARALCLTITATLTGAGTVNLPAITGGKAYLVINNSVGGFAVTVKVTGLTGVSVPNGKAMWLWNNGTDIVDGVNYVSSLSLGSALALTSGGTGATTASGARTNLGSTTLGDNLFTIANPSAVTFPRFNADNTVSSLAASAFRTAIGAGTGDGTVTSVTGTSPVASSGGTTPAISLSAGYGDTQNPYASKTANYFLAAPNGSAGAPSFRAIAAADVPTLNQNTTGTAAGLSVTLAVASGGTGVTSSTGSGSVVLSNSPTLVTPALGTPASGNLENCTFPTLNQNTTGTAAGLSATLAVSSGGTGQTSYTDGQLLIGNSTGNTLTKATLTAGSGVSITNAGGSITISATGSGGTVTDVSATAPVASSGGTAPTISLNNNYGDTLNPYASKTANYVLAAPNGSAGAPSFRALVAADIPTLNQNTTGTAAGLSVTLAVSSGGTGQTTQQAAINALAGAQTAGQYLRGDGTNVTMSTIQAADIPTLNQNTTGTAAGLSATLAVASGGTGVTSSTGSGSVVLSNSPTLVTPALGTPASGNLANCTFPTLNQNTTGTAASTPKLLTTNFTVQESGGKLYFYYGATAIASMDSSGNFISLANVTGYGTP